VDCYRLTRSTGNSRNALPHQEQVVWGLAALESLAGPVTRPVR